MIGGRSRRITAVPLKTGYITAVPLKNRLPRKILASITGF